MNKIKSLQQVYSLKQYDKNYVLYNYFSNFYLSAKYIKAAGESFHFFILQLYLFFILAI